MFICNSLAIYTLHIHTGYQGNASHFSQRQRLGRRLREQWREGGLERQEGGDYTAYNTNSTVTCQEWGIVRQPVALNGCLKIHRTKCNFIKYMQDTYYWLPVSELINICSNCLSSILYIMKIKKSHLNWCILCLESPLQQKPSLHDIFVWTSCVV